MKRYLLFISLICSSFLQAQDLKEEFARMNNFLNEKSSYKLSVQYKAGNEDQEEQGLVSVVVHSKGLFYDIDGSHMMINEEYTILVDDQERMLIYSENQEVKKRNSFSFSNQLLKGIDTLVANSDSVMFTSSGDIRTYTLRFESSYFDLIQLHFSEQMLKEVEYFYNEEFVHEVGVRTTCAVSLDSETTIDERAFDTAFYILSKNGTMVPTEKFSNYLITHNEALESYLD